MEIPLPMPLSVICSPIHMRSAEPAVIPTTAITISANFLAALAVVYPTRRPWLPKPTAIATDSMSARPMVTYLVYSVSFFLPSSSFESSSSDGNATVRSWMMMEDVIYGVMDSAKIDSCSKEPPVIVLNHPNASLFDMESNSCWKYAELTPGIGRFEPNLMTTSIRKTKISLFLKSFTLNALSSDLSIRSPHRFRLKLRSFP